MWDNAKNYATGIWNSSMARGSAEWKLNKEEILHGVMKRTKNGSDNSRLNSYEATILSGMSQINNGVVRGDKAAELKGSLPTYGNAFMNSFTSKGSMKAAGVGAVVGGSYGAIDNDTSILKGASIGAGLGYVGKGLFGMAGERVGLNRKAFDKIDEISLDDLDFGGMP